MYHVGCLNCGLQNGVGTCIDEAFTDDTKNTLRWLWNDSCIEKHYTEEALEILGIQNGNYVLIDNQTRKIANVVTDVKAAKDYILRNNHAAYSIYLNLEGILQDLGHSWIIRELFE